MASKPSIVFFGSGPVALSSLILLEPAVTIEAIVTKPATEAELRHAFPEAPLYAVSSRKELDTLCQQQQFQSSCGILIDFGIIVSQLVIDSFARGIINSHFSLLPEWRGADPITFSILSGQKETGVSLMLLVTGMDEGPLLAQAPYDIPLTATTPQLTEELIQISDAMLKEVLPLYLAGDVQPQAQLAATIGPKEPTYSRKLTKEDGRLDWTKPAATLEREVRAFSSWPYSYTTLAGKDIIVTAAEIVDDTGNPGEVRADKRTLVVCCGEQALNILRLKPAGKSEMTAQAFLAGYRNLL